MSAIGANSMMIGPQGIAFFRMKERGRSISGREGKSHMIVSSLAGALNGIAGL
jgi:hypothetical protein